MAYLGVVGLIALIALALLSSGLSQTVSAGIDGAVCKVTGAQGCTTPAAQVSLPPINVPTGKPVVTPLQRALAGTHAALGDSYSSGEGLGPYQQGSDQVCPSDSAGTSCVADKCHRSPNAFGPGLDAALPFKGGGTFAACSGARTTDIAPITCDSAVPPHCTVVADPSMCSPGKGGQYGEGYQICHVSANTSLITLSIGGNDAGFSNVLRTCILQAAECPNTQAGIDAAFNKLTGELPALYAALKARAPKARIVVTGYPRLFPDPPTGPVQCAVMLCSVSVANQQYLNLKTQQLDALVCKSAAAAGAECVNPYDAFAGHELGSTDPYINGVTLGSGSFHPTQEGQNRLLQLIQHQVTHG